MSLLPKRRPDDPDNVNVFASEFEALRSADSARIDRMNQYRAEGQEARSPELMHAVGASAEARDYNKRTRREQPTFRHHIPLPLSKALNVKHSYRISGKLPDCIVDRRDESPAERYRSDTMEKIVWAIMRASRGSTARAPASRCRRLRRICAG